VRFDLVFHSAVFSRLLFSRILSAYPFLATYLFFSFWWRVWLVV